MRELKKAPFFWLNATEATITLGAFLLSIFCYTFVSDDYDFFLNNMASGQFTDFSLIDWYFLGFIGIKNIYMALYDWLPKYAWLPVGLIATSLLILYGALVSIRKIIFENNSSIFFIRLVQTGFALSFIENFSCPSQTRVGLLLSGIALFNIAFTRNLTSKGVWINSGVFLLGLLYRPETALSMLLLVSAGCLIYYKSIITYLLRFWLPIVVALIYISGLTLYWSYSDDFLIKVEPEVEYELMINNTVPVSAMKTAEDTVKYEAATQGLFMFDPQVMTVDFLRSIIQQGENWWDIARFKKGGSRFSEYIAHFPFLWVTIAVLLLLSLFNYNSRRQSVLFLLCLLGGVYYLCYRQLLHDRHLLPYLQISFLIMLYYVFTSSVKVGIGGMFLFIIAGTVASCFNLLLFSSRNISKANTMHCSEKEMIDFENKQHGRLIVVTLEPILYLFDHELSIYNRNYQKNTYVMYDAFNYSLVKRNMDYLSRLCDCNARNPPDFFKWLSDNNALYIADTARFALTAKYMKVIYGQDVYFEKDSATSLTGCERHIIEARKVYIKRNEETLF